MKPLGRHTGMPARANRRRVTAAAPFLPTSLPGCVIWLRSDLGVSLDGSSKVQTWSDQSGNGNHFSQSTASQRPTVTTVGGKPAITFATASAHELNCTSLTGWPSAAADQKKIALYFVFAHTVWNRWVINISINASTYNRGYFMGTQSSVQWSEYLQNFTDAAQSHAYNAKTTGVTRQHISYFDATDGKRYMREDKVAKVSSPVITSAPPAATAIKLGGLWTLPATDFEGTMREFAIFYPSPTLTQLQQLETYGSTQWTI